MSKFIAGTVLVTLAFVLVGCGSGESGGDVPELKGKVETSVAPASAAPDARAGGAAGATGDQGGR